ncbi:UNVERIFIED_ORG: uncharacterized protein DUF1963 [Martelella mediterranea]
MAGLTRRSFLAAGFSAMAAGSVRADVPGPPGPYYPTLAALKDSLADYGVGWFDRRALAKLARPTTMFTSKALPDSAIAIGKTKIGGAPDVPPQFDWPMRDVSSAGLGEVKILKKLAQEHPEYRLDDEIARKQALASRPAPLAFLMQIDLAEAAKAGPMDPDIPQNGRLLLFFDFVFLPWFGEQQDEKSFRLIYLEDGVGPLQRQPTPDLGLSLWGETPTGDAPQTDAERLQAQQLPPARLTPVFSYTLPGGGTYPMMTRWPWPDVAPHQAWLDAQTALAEAGSQLFGWPEYVQSDPGIDLGADDAHVNLPHNSLFIPTIRAMPGPITNWIPLVSVLGYDSDFIDFNGGYYVMIRRTDLRRRDFSKAVIVYQTD